MSHRQSFYGTAPNQVFFNIRVNDRDGGQVPDWNTPIKYQEWNVPGAFPPRGELDLIRFGYSTVTWRIWLASREDYQALRARWGSADTLYVIRGLQSQGDSVAPTLGNLYDVLPSTELVDLGRPAFAVDARNGLEVDVTFKRLFDPATGLVVS